MSKNINHSTLDEQKFKKQTTNIDKIVRDVGQLAIHRGNIFREPIDHASYKEIVELNCFYLKY